MCMGSLTQQLNGMNRLFPFVGSSVSKSLRQPCKQLELLLRSCSTCSACSSGFLQSVHFAHNHPDKSFCSTKMGFKLILLTVSIYRYFSTQKDGTKPVLEMSIDELLSIFTNQKSKRIEVCKAGERLVKECIRLSEVVFNFYFCKT